VRQTSIVRTRSRNTLFARRRPGRSCRLVFRTETKSPFGIYRPKGLAREQICENLRPYARTSGEMTSPQ
jgi:hypothetical protein